MVKYESTVPDHFKRLASFDYYKQGLSCTDNIIMTQTTRFLVQIRKYFAEKYLQGNGIEIGAQHLPTLSNNSNRNIKYVDYLSHESLSEKCGMPIESLVKVDYVSSADDLKEISNQSLDFVIANHVLEHLFNPIKGLIELIRVIKDNGLIFASMPNFKSNEYDYLRKPPPIQTLVDVYEGRITSDLKYQCYYEFVKFADFVQENTKEFEDKMIWFVQSDYRPHFFVYDRKLLVDMIDYLKSIGIPISIFCEFSFDKSYEIILILKKGRTNDIISLSETQQFDILKHIIYQHDDTNFLELNVKK